MFIGASLSEPHTCQTASPAIYICLAWVGLKTGIGNEETEMGNEKLRVQCTCIFDSLARPGTCSWCESTSCKTT